MVRISWTEESIRWLEGIFEYIAAENPAAAEQVVQGIYQRAQRLSQFPHMGYRYDRSEREVRILLYGHYRIAYLVKPNGDVDVLGVFHGALDLTKYRLQSSKALVTRLALARPAPTTLATELKRYVLRG